MRTKLRGKISLLFMMCAMLLAIPAVAFADNILDTVADNVTAALPLTAGDPNSTGTAQVRIAATSNDGNNQCNIDLATQSVTLSFVTPSGVTATAVDGATATPGQMKFTACGVQQNVKFSASSSAVPGNYTVTATIVQNNTTGTYDNRVSIPIKVNAPAVADADGDGVADASDNCVNVANANQADADADGTGDACDPTPNPPPPDADGDGVADASDNCVNVANANQADADADGTGDVCDPTPNPNTAPNVSVAGVTDGASYEKGSVPTVTCDVRDAEDTNESASPVIDSSALNSYGLGSEKVTCSYTDAGGLKASDSKTYSIVDNTAPQLTLPDNITEPATGANGATVNFSASAKDAVDGSVSVSCSPESGSTFEVGTTTVNCSATDGSGNKASGSFTVTVEDKTAPELTVPADITEEATGANGAPVSFTATAKDAVDPNPSVTCEANGAAVKSGDTFALGTTTVSCIAKDSAGNQSDPKTFTVTVEDKTAPELNMPENKTVEATGPNGAAVSFAREAKDVVDGPVAVTCEANGAAVKSGDTFALGTTTVDCSATDKAGNKSSDSFTVKVEDTTVPKLTLPANITEEATGANGAPVSFTATASDLVDGNVNVSCTPNSGSTIALGTTTVDCSATDKAGNKSEGSFTVKVQDTTKPALTLPANITEEAKGPDGNAVTYSATASDLVDGNVNVSCTPNSGSTFAIDTTTVNCEATDAAENKATGSFTVKVQDTTAPTNIQFAGNINDGGSFFFGDVPAQPTCTADDAGSGMKDCVVTGHSTAVGTHTLTATATDNAGNTATKKITYTVKPYTFKGFYQPVDMGGVFNTVKGGSTVPLKFELFKGDTELTSTSYINQPLRTQKIDCASGATTDDIELLATGGTSLRYDSTGGQYIYNWKTPTGAGSCYKVTVTATDGSSITALFRLK